MRAYEIQTGTDIDGLREVERPSPPPRPGQVKVRVRAVSLNYRDLNTVRHAAARKLRLPLIPCSDGAGEVAEVGAGVTRVGEGDRVAGIFTQAWLDGPVRPEYEPSSLGGGMDGMLAEYVTLSQEGLVHLPPHLSFEEGSTLPCAAVTAWNGMFVADHVQAGDTILAQGTGGVSIFALQFGVMTGARVIVTSKSDAKLARAAELWGRRNDQLRDRAGMGPAGAGAHRRARRRSRRRGRGRGDAGTVVPRRPHRGRDQPHRHPQRRAQGRPHAGADAAAPASGHHRRLPRDVRGDEPRHRGQRTAAGRRPRPTPSSRPGTRSTTWSRRPTLGRSSSPSSGAPSTAAR